MAFFSTFTINLLTVKTLLATAFIKHFDFMSGFQDKSVLLLTVLTSVLASLTRVLVEVCLKIREGKSHIGKLAYFTFIGAEEADTNPEPWVLNGFLVSSAAYALALVFYMVVKNWKNRRSQGILENNQISRMESSANGVTASAMVALLVLVVIFIAMWQYARKVGRQCKEVIVPTLVSYVYFVGAQLFCEQ